MDRLGERWSVYRLGERFLKRPWRTLPKGRSLPEEIWRRRHRGILVLLWAHAVGIACFGVLRGHGLAHSLSEATVVAGIALLASRQQLARGLQSGAATVGLVTCSAILVHLSGGAIEMHFHFFVMVGVITLYQDWLPFLLAIGYVVLHHGVLGVLDPTTVYNHPAAWRNPWKWALIHGVFVVGASIASLTAWRLNEEGFRDPLTGLANRALFYDRVEHALARSQRHQQPIVVLFLDLDEFKTINDSLGHGAGDQLLVAVAERLRTCLRDADTAARLGGDEFAILLEEIEEAGPALVAQRVLDTLQAPFVLSGREVFVNASIGIAVGSVQQDANELLRDADAAMYVAKTNGKGRFETFAPAMHDAVMERLTLQVELQRAVEQQEFTIQYQPIVELDSGRITGVEALVRWQHPVRGEMPPVQFIPLAEQTGLIVPIGRWVLQQACQQARRWHIQHPTTPPLGVSVNLSARQLQQPGLVSDVAAALAGSGLDPASLTLEITESVQVHDTEATITVLSNLKTLGVRLAIDDFGTGYSSLSYLQRFPVDILKIDKSFIDGVANGAEASTVARAITKLGHSLGLETVAEGIEEPEQRTAIAAMGCHQGQGYHFARPLDADAITQLLDDHSPSDPQPASHQPQGDPALPVPSSG
jgi:diguanylate cyclase (GGDEF)-like protein